MLLFFFSKKKADTHNWVAAARVLFVRQANEWYYRTTIKLKVVGSKEGRNGSWLVRKEASNYYTSCLLHTSFIILTKKIKKLPYVYITCVTLLGPLGPHGI